MAGLTQPVLFSGRLPTLGSSVQRSVRFVQASRKTNPNDSGYAGSAERMVSSAGEGERAGLRSGAHANGGAVSPKQRLDTPPAGNIRKLKNAERLSLAREVTRSDPPHASTVI